MATCTGCQGTNDDAATACIYCGQTLKKRGWWRRILDSLAGDQSLAHTRAGRKLREQGRIDEAIGEFNEAIRINPTLAAAFDNRAFAYLMRDQYDEAVADLNEAIRLNPQDAYYHNSRGGTYTEMGQYDRALKDLSEAIRLNPRLAAAYENRALTYTSLGRGAEAEEDVKQVARLGVDTSPLRKLIEDEKGQRP
jgi:tetratricopeptide (TPR) repeat protein